MVSVAGGPDCYRGGAITAQQAASGRTSAAVGTHHGTGLRGSGGAIRKRNSAATDAGRQNGEYFSK